MANLQGNGRDDIMRMIFGIILALTSDHQGSREAPELKGRKKQSLQNNNIDALSSIQLPVQCTTISYSYNSIPAECIALLAAK